MSVNKVILIGNMGGDPNMRYGANGNAVANFSLATSDYWFDQTTNEKREKTEWHKVVAFGRTAELIGQYCRKGSKVYIEGKLQTRSWNDQQTGTQRYITEIVVDNIQFLTPKNEGAASYDDSFGDYPGSYTARPGANGGPASGGYGRPPVNNYNAAPMGPDDGFNGAPAKGFGPANYNNPPGGLPSNPGPANPPGPAPGNPAPLGMPGGDGFTEDEDIPF